MNEQPIEHSITAEFLEQYCGYKSWTDAREDIQELAERFERTYSATVRIQTQRIGGYKLLITPSRAADRAAIRDGTQEFLYWLDNE